MPDVNTIESIRNWFRTCPAINGSKKFGVDSLGRDPTEYAILSSPSPIATGVDVTGETFIKTQQELNFAFVSRENYGQDVLQNLANLGFYDSVIDWIIQQNIKKNFPTIHGGTVTQIMPSQTQYLRDANTGDGKYCIQCKIKYRRI